MLNCWTTRGKHNLVIGMTEAEISLNDIAVHVDIHKTVVYRRINRVGQTRLAADRPILHRQKKITPWEDVSFVSHQGGAFFPANPINFPWYASIHSTRLLYTQMVVKIFKSISFKTFL